MKIYIVPMNTSGSGYYDVAVRVRKDTSPVLFMQNVCLTLNGASDIGPYTSNPSTAFHLLGDIADNVDLQDGDILLIQQKKGLSQSVELEVEPVGEKAYASPDMPFTSISLAARMEKALCVCIADNVYKNVTSASIQIYNRANSLYKKHPSFQNIMVKDEAGNLKETSLLSLTCMQEDSFIKWAEPLILAMDDNYGTVFSIAKQILEQAKVPHGFTLLSQEEQVSAFIEFSKKHADSVKETVPDKLIKYLETSPEYRASLDKLKEAGLGKSATQQFNVLQQVGYFGGTFESLYETDDKRILYNLSDMGAGKTLMTVQSIFVLDLLKLADFEAGEKNDNVEVAGLLLPDKYLIAPALSIKSSWVDTFKLFYGVEKVNEYEYALTAEYKGMKAKSTLYIAPFTVRGGKIFAQNKFSESPYYSNYLIVDEIHQLVRRRISRVKFFPSGIVPVDLYQIFVLSGTMSNLKAGEWLSLIRFLGDTRMLKSASDAKLDRDSLERDYYDNISEAAENIETIQHRKFNVDDYQDAETYKIQVKKKSTVEEDYFMRYGSKVIKPYPSSDGIPIQTIFSQKRFTMAVEPEESDNVNFELFYQIAASSAITAQSLQVAEELFGEQKTQHKSSIIRTLSPFTNEEIALLDTLHQIAADAGKYRSPAIGRQINDAILNLNDGLQQKDLYSLISGFADTNTRFLEYLAALDVNVLERLPKTGLIKSPKVTETQKFQVLKNLLDQNEEETFLIVVNDYYAMKTLAEALDIAYLTKQELKDEMAYQELLDGLFEKQSIVIVTQDMIKSSLDLVQANRLVQYQLNTEVSDIIQTQNRINRIGQTRETRCYYIAADRLQNTLIELFLDSYRNIRVAHRGIVELFADLSSQIDVINDYLNVAFKRLGEESPEEEVPVAEPDEAAAMDTDLTAPPILPKGCVIPAVNGICSAVLFPEKNGVSVLVPSKGGMPQNLGYLKPGLVSGITAPTRASWDIGRMRLVS